jgi:hypothetical protein
MILKPEVNTKNKIIANAELAVPLLKSIFCIISGREEEIQNVDRKIRKIRTVYKLRHRKA